MAISPYSGNNTIKKLGNYYVAYRSDEPCYYDDIIYGLISSDGQNWDRIDVLFSDFDPQVVRTVGYNPIAQEIYLVRNTGNGVGRGRLDALSSTGDPTEIISPFPSESVFNSEMFPYDNKFRFFSGARLLEFNTDDFQPSTADSQYLDYTTSNINKRAFIVATADRLVRIDLDYGVYHATFANPNTWVKVASASSIDYIEANDRIEYVAYLNSEFYIHISNYSSNKYRTVKSSNGYTSTSSDLFSSYQRKPALYNAGTYIRLGIWYSYTHQFEVSTDGITWTTLPSISGLMYGSYFGFIKHINGEYLFTHGSYDPASKVLYRTSNLTSATISLTGGILDVAYNGSIYMAVTASGLIYTSPDAITWAAATPPDFTGLTLKRLHAIGADFILTDSKNRAILVTRDFGVTWQRKDMPTIINDYDIFSSVPDEDYVESGSLIFISSFGHRYDNKSLYGDFVMKSGDLGDTWNYTVADLQARIKPSYYSHKVIPLNNGAVLYPRNIDGYSDVSLADKLTVSQDGGVTWVTLNTGITVPAAVSSSYGVYQDLYHDGTRYVLMICDTGYTSISFYSSVDLVSWQPESVDMAIAPASVGPLFSIVNAPRLYILGNARLLVFDYGLLSDYYEDTIQSSVLLYSSAGYSSWQNKILYSNDSHTWVFANSTETEYPYMIGYDDNEGVYGNLRCADLAYDAAQKRVVVLGVGVGAPSSEESPEEPPEEFPEEF